MKRKSLGLIVMLAMMMSLAFSLSCVTAFADDVIEIDDIDDLYNVRNNMSGNYKLMCDIDMTDAVATGGKYNYSGKGWEPFGATTQTEFTGTFDGNGHCITGFSITGLISTASDDTNSNALFWRNDGIIENLRIEGTINTVGSNGYNNALIAGVNNGLIKNCVAHGTIVYGSFVGLITGKNSGTIRLFSFHYYTGPPPFFQSFSSRKSAVVVFQVLFPRIFPEMLVLLAFLFSV